MNRFVVISGCSSGGKSSLLAELAQRGYAVVEEPGRRIVREETASGGTALPWLDAHAFIRRALAMAAADLASAAANPAWTFFDRSAIDAASASAEMTGTPLSHPPGRYHRAVFMAPPWPELYVTDGERRHGLHQAIAEYDRLLRDYPALGYDVVLLPRLSITERADFVLKRWARRRKASHALLAIDIDGPSTDWKAQ
ncbi:AAA family ATPase [Devosia sp.]|uniref:AAA family ATPase n=1 Tax=Devosia sp. TaxID=1871048 RepID=UPI0037C0021A